MCCKKETSSCCELGKGINPGVDKAVCCNRPSVCTRQLVTAVGETEKDALRVCCPKERTVPAGRLGGARCCPPGQVSNGGDFILRPERDGTSPLCCPKAQVCRKLDGKPGCCNSGERCVNGACVRAAR